MSAYLDYARNQLEKLKLGYENDTSSFQAKNWIKKIYIEKYNIDADCASHSSLLWFIKIPEFNPMIQELIEIVIDYKIKSLLTIFNIDKSELFNLQYKDELYGAFLESNRQARLEIDDIGQTANQLDRVKEFVNKDQMPSVQAKIFIRDIYVNKYYIEPIHAAHAALLWFIKIPEFNDVIGELAEAIIENKINLLVFSFGIDYTDLLNIKDKNELYCAFLDLNRQAHIEI
jgi:hypothetical protein